MSLLAYLALLPMLSGTRDGRLAAGLGNMLILVGGVAAVSRSRRHTRIAVVMLAVCLPLQVMAIVAPNETLITAVELTMLPFYGFAVVSLLAFVLRPGVVGADRLYAAVSVYILFGFVWALGYFALMHWSPDAFVATAREAAEHRLVYGDMLYFSFVSLTSTGYGDIVPVSPGARSMTVFEHIVGVMYVAILIARLAGSYTSGREE
jgi:hypothetical protein